MERPIVIIPTLNPLPNLVNFVNKLMKLDIEQVIIVNDGSDEKYGKIFEELAKIKNCIILNHPENKGKGRAIKTGFEYVLKKYPKSGFVLTVGAHGQHTIDDLQLLLHNLKIFSNGIILGIRSFQSKDMSFMHSLGNRAATMLFNLLFHKRILDTQTGLRCIPIKELPWLLKVPGETFDYDMNMLVEAIQRKVPIYEIPIGRVKVKKNSIMNYDEIMNTKTIIQQILANFTKHHKKY